MPSSSHCLLAVTVNARVGAVNQNGASSSDFPLRVLGNRAPLGVRPHEGVLADRPALLLPLGESDVHAGLKAIGVRLDPRWSDQSCMTEVREPQLCQGRSEAPVLLVEGTLHGIDAVEQMLGGSRRVGA